MSSSVRATVRPGYGSRWIAARSRFARAAASTVGNRSSSTEPLPHQETMTVPAPELRISFI
jgi:hypothetical protein